MGIQFGIYGGTLDRDALQQFPTQVDGYPVIYYSKDGCTLCAACASEQDTSDPAIGADFYYEGPVCQCDDCGADIESAYGDPDDDDLAAD